MNLVYLNGAIVPAESARVSLFDRGFLYGDGIFESVRIQAGRPFRWNDHLARLQRGLAATGIVLKEPLSALTAGAEELLAANACTQAHAVLRITLSRGPGPRGYSPRGAGPATVAMSLHPRPVPPEGGVRLVVSRLQVLAGDPLAAVKTANKLHQVLARAEAEDAGADDALLANQNGELVEATGSNLFWIEGRCLFTPPCASGLLPGVARGVLLELAPGLGWRVLETAGTPEALRKSDGVFLANVASGPVEVASLDGQMLSRSAGFYELRAGFEAVVNAPDIPPDRQT